MAKLTKNQPHTEAARVLAEAAKILRGYCLHAEIEKKRLKLGKRDVDALIRVGLAPNEALFIADLKHRPNVATINQTLAATDRDKTLVIADFFPPPVADKLREAQVGYVDLAGNAWLKTDDYLVWVEGRPQARKPAGARTARAFTLGGLQVVFALLTNPEWIQLATRTLATLAGVANGTVAAALRDLERQGFVLGNRAGKRRLRNREQLLARWTEGYLQRLEQATLINRYAAEGNANEWWKNTDDIHVLLGGEVAAAEMTKFLTPHLITLYVEGNPGRVVLKNRLREDPNGNVMLKRKFWNFQPVDRTHDRLAPPVLIYADLLATNDARCIETANRIKEQQLARLLED